MTPTRESLPGGCRAAVRSGDWRPKVPLLIRLGRLASSLKYPPIDVSCRRCALFGLLEQGEPGIHPASSKSGRPTTDSVKACLRSSLENSSAVPRNPRPRPPPRSPRPRAVGPHRRTGAHPDRPISHPANPPPLHARPPRVGPHSPIPGRPPPGIARSDAGADPEAVPRRAQPPRRARPGPNGPSATTDPASRPVIRNAGPVHPGVRTPVAGVSRGGARMAAAVAGIRAGVAIPVGVARRKGRPRRATTRCARWRLAWRRICRKSPRTMSFP